MIHWYADNSELCGIWRAEIPDILVFGGIAVDDNGRKELQRVIKEIKLNYNSDSNIPIKWNLRDLERYYIDHNLIKIYSKLLQDSKTWRSEIIRKLASIDFKIIISLLLCHGTNRDFLKKTRREVIRFSFSDALMRLGYYVKGVIPTEIEVILDWPAGNKKDPFTIEYNSAYYYGETADHHIAYYCKSLNNLGFCDSPYFTSMNECSLLQISDLIVGATREMVELSLNKRDDSFGFSLLKKLKDKFYGAPNNIIGRGISISPTKGEFFDKVSNIISKLKD